MKFDANLPIYIQIMDEIKRRIVIGEYTSAQKVPPVRELAVNFGVNPNTVQRALSELEREGLLVSERTAGRFISEDVEKIAALKKTVCEQKVDAFIKEIQQYGWSEEEIMTTMKERLQYGKAD